MVFWRAVIRNTGTRPRCWPGQRKEGQPTFYQRDPRILNRYQVWPGPFSSKSEAEDAAKSLKAVLKKPLKIEAIENPVPK